MLHYSFIGYLAASGVVLLLCWAVWRLFLEQNAAPSYSRAAILSIYVLSLAVPLLAALTPVLTLERTAPPTVDLEFFQPMEGVGEIYTPVDYTAILNSGLLIVYLTGVGILLVVTARSLWQLARLRRKSRSVTGRRFRIYIHNNASLSTFSWLRDIFLRADSVDGASDDVEILIDHESAHIDLYHWADLLFAQAMVVLQWFNPAAWMLRSQLQRIHEYQADACVLGKGVDPKRYQLILVKNISGNRFTGLTDGLNNCSLKQRILMMQKTTRRGSTAVRTVAVLAVAIGATVALHQPAVASLLGTVSPVVTENPLTETAPPAIEGQKSSEGVTWIVDGKEVTSEELEAIKPDDIASIKVDKQGEPKLIITLKDTAGETMHSESGASDTSLLMAYANSNTVAEPPVESKSEPAPASTVASRQPEERPKILDGAYLAPETMPEYPGGEAELMIDIARTLKYPESELKDDVSALVVVQFVVDTDGKIGKMKVVKSQGDAFDNAALDAIRALPGTWIPATVDGKPVDAWFALPIRFRTLDNGNYKFIQPM